MEDHERASSEARVTRRGQEWTSLVLGQRGPQLVIGWRPRPQQLEAARVELHQSIGAALRDIATETVSGLGNRAYVEYSTYATPDPGEEYLSLPRAQLPMSASATSDETAQVATLLRLLADPAELHVLHANELRDGSFLFYAVALASAEEEPLLFVKQLNPTGLLRRAAVFGHLSGTLRRVDKPDLAFAYDFDVVITRDELVVLNKTAFDRLFNDLQLTAAQVPIDITELRAALGTRLSLSPAAEASLTAACSKRITFAKRLHRLVEQGNYGKLDTASFREALDSHSEASADYLDADGRVSVTESRVGHLLDIFEGRWWTSDFTHQRRRADAFRPRI